MSLQLSNVDDSPRADQEQKAKHGDASGGNEIYISIIIPISERHDDITKLFLNYEQEVGKIARPFEFIFIIDGSFDRAYNELKELRIQHPEIKIIKLNKTFGEATALSVGFRKARGEYIVTLHPYFQSEPAGILRVLEQLEEGTDLVITRRFPRVDSILNQVQTQAFHWLIKKLTDISFRDMSSGLRGMHRKVAMDINLYGDLHRFIPLLAQMQGFKIKEIEIKQCTEESSIRIYKPGVYLRRVLDIFTVFFLFKFTKKPLRFFGLIGAAFFTSGLLINIFLSLQRLLLHTELANRPLLLLGVLVMVLGIQIASIGLLGEIIIFTHARETKDYQIEEILE